MGAGPSQMPEEGACPLPSPPLPSPSLDGERHRQGRGLVPRLWGWCLGYRAMEEQEPRPGRSRGMAQGPFARIHGLLIPD